MKKNFLTVEHIMARVEYLAPHFGEDSVIYGVPRGGVPVALAMAGEYGCKITTDPEEATHIVDDLTDSGRTKDKYMMLYPNADFVVLYNKKMEFDDNRWLTFPWERSYEKEDLSADDIFIRLLQYIGEDVEREGLKDTPKRMAKAWKEWTEGYSMNPEDFVTTFKDGAKGYDEIILEKNLPFYSHCEHHCAAFFGRAHIAYIPGNGSVLGISKLGRILDMYSKRLQIQERLTTQIADCIEEWIDPLGVAVIIEARHLCTESRGLSKQGQEMVTSSMRGVFRDKASARNELMLLIK